MFGISGLEFLAILLVAIAVIPAKDWPNVARAIGKFVRHARGFIGKIQDGIDRIEDEIHKEIPIDKLSQKTMNDMVETFSTYSPPRKRARKRAKK